MEQKIIAVVAGREIKESDFEKFLQNVPREQQAYLSNPQFRQQCLDQFVALQRMSLRSGSPLKSHHIFLWNLSEYVLREQSLLL